MIVRVEEPDDRRASLDVERAAFRTDGESSIEAVRDEPGSFALVAQDDDREIVGHVQLSTAWIGMMPSWRSARSPCGRIASARASVRG